MTMLKEKVNVQIAPDALNSILSFFNVLEHLTSESEQDVLELLSGEAKAFRFPQKNEGIRYVGLLFQHKESKKVMQLVVEMSDNVTIIDSLVDVQVNELTDYFDVELTFTKEESCTFSPDFIAAFYNLKVEQQHNNIIEQLEGWSNYIEFLIQKSDHVYVIQKVEQIVNNEFNIYLYPEKALENIVFEAEEELIVDYAFNKQKIATVTAWDVTQFKLKVTSKQSLQNMVGQEVKIQNKRNYEQLLKRNGYIKNLIVKEMKKPSIHHPLLNPMYPLELGGKYYGYSTKETAVISAFEELLNLAETQSEKIIVVSDQPEVEIVLTEQHQKILPINSLNEKQHIIEKIKQPIKEKSDFKYKELLNEVSTDERLIQGRAIQSLEEKIVVRTQRIENFEEVQRYLSTESTKNTNKINAFHSLISKYEEEQEQLAFRNDQLIQVKDDLEKTIKEQQSVLEEMKLKQVEEKQLFTVLEKDWLTFNKESPIYTDHITTQKNITKSENIIEDCLSKQKVIRDEIAVGDNLQQKMQSEFEAFKENQDVKKVDQLIVNMKEAAYFLDTHVDLQFANSYAELTHIYMEKFVEIEALEERLKPRERMIEDELRASQLTVVKPHMSRYNFDRHYTEEKMAIVINLLENKPLAIGINYKSKQRWKESFQDAVEDLYSMMFAMQTEKALLEKKLMAQLDYADQLLNYFENDIQQLNIILEDQQISLKNSESEYQAIIDAANADIQIMEEKIEQAIQSTEKRTTLYASLVDLENKRKSFKAELLAKYESLELQSNEIEKASKFIFDLENQHKEKVKEVLNDKREMNIQIDVLQHDIINSKGAIEKLKQENQLINEQYEEIVKQIHVIQLEMDEFELQIQRISENISNKDAMLQQNKKMVSVLKNWQEQLDRSQTNASWEKLVDQQSRLRFLPSINEVEHRADQTIVCKDQQFSWMEVVCQLEKPSNLFFVTTDISQRQLIELQAFEDFLAFQGKNILQRKKMIELLKMNPFSKFAQSYERLETPYLVEEQSKTSFM